MENQLTWQLALREATYPSNLLTLSRLLLIPALIGFLRRPHHEREALICLAAAVLTDAVDGTLARQRGEVSQLGKILDPIADKLLIDSTAIMLSHTRNFPWWATGLLLFRDLGILAAAGVVMHHKAEITVSGWSGKATTAGLALSALAYLADGERFGKPILYLAMVPFAISFIEYGLQFIKAMRT